MRNIDLFDDYLMGHLNAEDKKAFETRLSEDAALKSEFDTHKKFVKTLQSNNAAQNFRNKLKAIHKDAFGTSNIKHINQEKTFFQKYIKPTGMAASIAIIAVITTITVLSTGGYVMKKQNSNYTQLEKQLQTSQEAIIEGISNIAKKKPGYIPANFTGTGFAINNKGYFITSLHLVRNCDSIFIGNASAERLGARIVHTDSKLDIAILKIDSANALSLKDLPYSFKTSASDLGEKIFTLGYPSQDIVYGEGTISSASRAGDTNMYQISIPVNPGNSGGPLLDEYGNIIGVVSGKNQNAEGTGFASKAVYINELLKNIEDKELQKELTPNKRNALKGIKRSEQIKRITPFVFNVYVYKAGN